jgi:transglutaminase-like putative cysteine protease
MNRASTRLWDFPCAAILVLILLSSSEGLYTTQWARGLGTAVVLALAGVLLGLALGFSQFKRAAVFWFSFGYSLPIAILVLGWLLYNKISWLERLATLSQRLLDALRLLFTSRPVHDTTLFVVFMALVFWVIGLLAGFALTRYGNFIAAVVPAGVVLVFIQLYGAGRGGGNFIFGAYIFLSVFELGRLTYVQRRVYWKEQNVAVLTESRTDLNVTLAVVTCILVALVWLAPTSAQSFSNLKTAWDNLNRPLRNVRENLGHAVAGLQAVGSAPPVIFYGDDMSLGNRAATGEATYFHIRTPFSTQRHYWRVRSYNFFLNDQWYTRNAANTRFEPSTTSIHLAEPEKLTGEFTITSMIANLAVLITPAGPVWVSHPSELVALQVPDDKFDPVQFLPEPPVMAGEQYTVHANVSQPTILQLRNAGDIYPDWVTAENLQLPDKLSPKVLALAQKISAQASTPYDKADAITQYLRSNITYVSAVENPPPGQDALDWFLFDSKKGFCNYYASAEVILLRSLGIPARMVVGFAQGEFTSPNLYVVRERDEHAWPEVFFPGIGWVEFEPTSNQAPLVRPSGETLPSNGLVGTLTPAFSAGQKPLNEPTPASAEETNTHSRSNLFLNWFLGLIFICAILFTILRINSFGLFNAVPDEEDGIAQGSLPLVLKHLVENQGLTPPAWLLHWAYLAGLNPIERSFVSVYRSLHWLGEKPDPAQTPAEAAAVLTGRLPNVSQEILVLLHEYQRQFFGRVYGRMHPASSAAKAIRKEALRVAIQQRWRRFRGIFGVDPNKIA